MCDNFRVNLFHIIVHALGGMFWSCYHSFTLTFFYTLYTIIFIILPQVRTIAIISNVCDVAMIRLALSSPPSRLTIVITPSPSSRSPSASYPSSSSPFLSSRYATPYSSTNYPLFSRHLSLLPRFSGFVPNFLLFRSLFSF